MRIKNGVRFVTGEQALSLAALIVQEVYLEYAVECVVTGGSEGRRPNNLHHRGWALDFRANHLTRIQANPLAALVRLRLGDGFDVVLHDAGSGLHLHVEYDPKD